METVSVSVLVKAVCVVVCPDLGEERACCWWGVVVEFVVLDRCWMLLLCAGDREPWPVCGNRPVLLFVLTVVVFW